MIKRVSDKDRFLKQLTSRIDQYEGQIRNGEMAEAYACFDLLMAITSGLEGGLTKTELTNAYPLEEWRDDQVMVPRKILQVISDGWEKYISDEAVRSL